jgi:hypothetical protein
MGYEPANAKPLDELKSSHFRQRGCHSRHFALIYQAEVAATDGAGEIGQRSIDCDLSGRVATWAADFELAAACCGVVARNRLSFDAHRLTRIVAHGRNQSEFFTKFGHEIWMRCDQGTVRDDLARYTTAPARRCVAPKRAAFSPRST